jgi:hypothetical protein
VLDTARPHGDTRARPVARPAREPAPRRLCRRPRAPSHDAGALRCTARLPRRSTRPRSASAVTLDAGGRVIPLCHSFSGRRGRRNSATSGVASPPRTRASAASTLASAPARQASRKPEIHRVDPEFGSTLRLLYTFESRDFQSNCWVNLRILGQPPVNFTL